MTGKDYIIVNGVSSHEIDLYIDTPPMPPLQAPLFETITIAGRAEQLTFNQVSREDIQIDISAYMFDDTAYNPTALYNYLANTQTLQTSKSADYVYRVSRLLNVVPSYRGHGKQFLQISFMCSPFRYSVSDTTYHTNKKEFFISNTGSFYAQPVYRLNGTGTLTLEVNDDSDNKLIIPNVKDFCIVDAEKLLVHKDNVIMTSKGQIPFMAVGSNKVVTNADSIEILMNTRWL